MTRETVVVLDLDEAARLFQMARRGGVVDSAEADLLAALADLLDRSAPTPDPAVTAEGDHPR